MRKMVGFERGGRGGWRRLDVGRKGMGPLDGDSNCGRRRRR